GRRLRRSRALPPQAVVRAHGGGLRLREGRLARQGAGRAAPRRAGRGRAAARLPLDDRARHRGERRLAAPARASRLRPRRPRAGDRKSTRLNSSHQIISYAVFCLKKKIKKKNRKDLSEQHNPCDQDKRVETTIRM